MRTHFSHYAMFFVSGEETFQDGFFIQSSLLFLQSFLQNRTDRYAADGFDIFCKKPRNTEGHENRNRKQDPVHRGVIHRPIKRGEKHSRKGTNHRPMEGINAERKPTEPCHRFQPEEKFDPFRPHEADQKKRRIEGFEIAVEDEFARKIGFGADLGQELHMTAVHEPKNEDRKRSKKVI